MFKKNEQSGISMGCIAIFIVAAIISVFILPDVIYAQKRYILFFLKAPIMSFMCTIFMVKSLGKHFF